MLMISLFLAGCSTTANDLELESECSESATAVTWDDESTGFSASEVFAWLETNFPASVSWSVDASEVGRSEVVAAFDADHDAARVIERVGDTSPCRSGPELVTRASLTVTLDGGDAVATGDVDVAASSVAAEGIWLLAPDSIEAATLETTLSGGFLDAIEATAEGGVWSDVETAPTNGPDALGNSEFSVGAKLGDGESLHSAALWLGTLDW
jgi:hypothetical protein